MPRFGDYETIDEPVRITEEPSYVSTIWKARHTAAGPGQLFVIKCFLPRRRGTSTGERPPNDTLDRDLGLEFLDSVKLLKKAQQQNPLFLAPIHHFGTTDMGAWYATDYYQRKTLKEYIVLQGGVESKALEHVVYSVVTGCLTLQQANGRSHANLKASNILLAGKPQLLRRTPLHLIDPRPSSSIRPSAVGRGGPATEAVSVQEIAELQDLRSLGELILQLVEGRIIGSGYDYNYPIAPSPAWTALGKDAERWRELCNRLLSPQLTLTDLNLASLAKEFRPRGLQIHAPKIIAGAAALGLVITVVLLASLFRRQPAQNGGDQARDPIANASTSAPDGTEARNELAQLRLAGQQAAQNQNWAAATNAWRQALQRADQLNDSVERQSARMELEFAQAMAEGERLLRRLQFSDARQQANRAATLKPNDQAANDLIKRIEQGRQLALDQRKRADLDGFVASGQQAERNRDWGAATNAWGQALRAADELKDDSQRQSASQELQYVRAMLEGERLLEQNDFEGAKQRANRALAQRTNDEAANSLLTRAELKHLAAIERGRTNQRKELDRLRTNAQQAEQSQDWPQAVIAWNQLAQAADALQDNTERLAARKGLDYVRPMQEAARLLQQGEHDSAKQQAVQALSLRPNDPAATALFNRAEQGRQAIAVRADLEKKRRDLDVLIASGREASRQKDWTKATNVFAQAVRQAGELNATATRDLASRELAYTLAMEFGESFLRERKADEAAQEATKALAVKANDISAEDLKRRAQTLKEQLAFEQGQKKKLSELETLIASGQQAAQERDWAKATSALARAVREAEELKLPARRDVARKELEYTQAMDLGERLLRERKADEAAEQAVKALALKPSDANAKDLGKRAQTAKTQLTVEQEQQSRLAALDGLITSGQQAAQQKDWAKATNALAQALRQAEELKLPAKRDLARNEFDYAQAMDLGEKLLRERKANDAAEQAVKALALKPSDANAMDLGRRAQIAKAQLASEQEQQKRLAALDLLITSGQQAAQQRDWPKATNALGQALRQAEELKVPAQRDVARKEFDYVQAMDLGERLLRERKADEAAQQAAKALALKPSDAHATDLGRRAQTTRTQLAAEQEQEKRLAALDLLITSGQQAAQQRDWPKATNALAQALRQAEDLKVSAQRDMVRNELDFARAMNLGENLLREKKADEAAQQAVKALALKPNDANATDLGRRAQTARTQLATEQEQQKRLAALDVLITSGQQAAQQRDWPKATNALAQALRQAEDLKVPAKRDVVRKELDYAQAMDLGENLLREKKADEAAQQAVKALALKPNDANATDLGKRAQTAKTQLAQQEQDSKRRADAAAKLEEDHQRAVIALREGKYEEVIQVAETHPGAERIQPLRRQAEEETQALRDAQQKFNSGDYTFVGVLARQEYRAKPPFTRLLETGRKEQEHLQSLNALKQANKATEVRDRLAQLPAEVRVKEPFQLLAQWSAKVASVRPLDSQPLPAQVDVARHDRLLEYWEVLFQIRKASRDVKVERIGFLSNRLRSFCLNQIDQMESDYKAAGRLDGQLDRRLDNLRKRIGAGSAAPTPALFQQPADPFIAPTRGPR